MTSTAQPYACTGYVITGGQLYHNPAIDCPMHPETGLNRRIAELQQRIDTVRALCATQTEGGCASYVRLADDEPIDDHGNYAAPPALSVAVADILRVLDGEPSR